MKTALILPCYNVEKNIDNVLNKLISLMKKKIIYKIIAIDDGSKDKTLKILKSFENKGLFIIIHKKNLGKGKSIDNGVKLAIKQGADSLIFFDADGEHDISVIKKSINMLKKYDVVFGSRFRETKKEKILVGRILMSQVFACLLERLFNIKTTDPYCGFKAIKVSAYNKINPKEERYDIELEMLIKSKLRKLKCGEIKIPVINPGWKIKFEKQKQNSLSDFAEWIDQQVRIIKKIIKEEKYKLNFKI